MEVLIKKLVEEAVIPAYAHDTDAGLDLVATSKEEDITYQTMTYGTGIAVAIPEGHVGLLFPRSSISKKTLSLANSVGVIDAGYRGEIMLKFRYSDLANNYDVGEKVGQLIILPYPKVEFKQVEELDETERGSGGFGSTDK